MDDLLEPAVCAELFDSLTAAAHNKTADTHKNAHKREQGLEASSTPRPGTSSAPWGCHVMQCVAVWEILHACS